MADPGTEAVVLDGIKKRNARADFLNAVDEFSAKSGLRILSRQRGKKPRCAFKQIGVCEFHSSAFFASHWMSGEKTLTGSTAERLRSTLDDRGLCAANVGDERTRRKRRPETLDEIDDGNHGGREDDKIAAAHSLGNTSGAFFDSAAILGAFENGSAIAADNAARKVALAESKSSDPPIRPVPMMVTCLKGITLGTSL